MVYSFRKTSRPKIPLSGAIRNRKGEGIGNLTRRKMMSDFSKLPVKQALMAMDKKCHWFHDESNESWTNIYSVLKRARERTPDWRNSREDNAIAYP